MEFFKKNTKIDFMRQRKWAALFSLAILIFSVTSLFLYPLNMGLDFTGGMQLELQTKGPANIAAIRNTLQKAGFSGASVIRYGKSSNVEITLSPKNFSDSNESKNLKIQKVFQNKMQSLFPKASILRVDFIGPQVGKQLANEGLLAVIVALIATMIYIALRFEYRFAISSTIALIHDPLLILGLFSFFHIEFNLIALAALLTVIGFSLNDTIVIFDRVRENFRKIRKGSAWDIMNISINQTLSRTIMTSGLTLIAVLVLYFYGGPMIEGFSLALIIGIVIGTYSSIYIAGASAIVMGLSRQDLLPPAKEIDDAP
jgi:preprotein translocase subunit SecF